MNSSTGPVRSLWGFGVVGSYAGLTRPPRPCVWKLCWMLMNSPFHPRHHLAVRRGHRTGLHPKDRLSVDSPISGGPSLGSQARRTFTHLCPLTCGQNSRRGFSAHEPLIARRGKGVGRFGRSGRLRTATCIRPEPYTSHFRVGRALSFCPLGVTITPVVAASSILERPAALSPCAFAQSAMGTCE